MVSAMVIGLFFAVLLPAAMMFVAAMLLIARDPSFLSDVRWDLEFLAMTAFEAAAGTHTVREARRRRLVAG